MAGLPNYLVEALRAYLVDRKEFNHLNLHKQDLIDEILEDAVRDGATAFDLVPPLSSTDVIILTEADLIGTSFNAKNWYYIKRFAAIAAIQSLVFINIRNRNSVNDNGFQVEEYDKARDWETVRSAMETKLEKDVNKYKRILQYQGFVATTVSLQRDGYEFH